MERYRLRDIPKGKRLSYIWLYYKWHILGALLAIAVLTGMLRPLWAGKVDLSILWLAESHDLATDTALESRLAQMPLDVDRDGRSRCLVHYVKFTGEDGRLTDEQMELVTLVGTGEFNVFLVSGAARDWLQSHDIMGTWGDFTGGQDDETPFCVPCSRLPVFWGEEWTAMEEMYLTIAPPPSQAEQQELYRRQMEAIHAFFTWNGETAYVGSDL